MVERLCPPRPQPPSVAAKGMPGAKADDSLVTGRWTNDPPGREPSTAAPRDGRSSRTGRCGAIARTCCPGAEERRCHLSLASNVHRYGHCFVTSCVCLRRRNREKLLAFVPVGQRRLGRRACQRRIRHGLGEHHCWLLLVQHALVSHNPGADERYRPPFCKLLFSLQPSPYIITCYHI